MRWLNRLEETLIAFLIATATAIVFAAVLHRYSTTLTVSVLNWGRANEMPWVFETAKGVFGVLRDINMTWAQELTIYLFVWMAKFGAAYGVRTGIHVGVDVLVNRLSAKWRSPLVVFSLLTGALFTATVGTLGAVLVYGLSQTDQVSADLEIPMWLVYLAVPLGSYLMSFRFMMVAYDFIKTGELPHHDHGHVDGLEEETTK